MKIVVWGLGKIGTRWVNNFRLHQDDIDAEIIALIDSNVEKTSLNEYEQNLLREKTDIVKLAYDYIVITSQKYFDEIKQELIVGFNVNAERIISYKEFFDKAGFTKKYECSMCGTKLMYWEYLGNDYKLFSKKRVIGAGRRKGFCPACGTMDKSRYVYYVLKEYTDIFEGKSVLHFAPEKGLKDKLLLAKGSYITADIVPGVAEVVADITNLQFEDGMFDYIICNHVLEHVVDEKAALSEMRRCLKANGKAVVTVPICWEQETFEDPDIVTPEARIEYYGQEDHVRLYGNDIVNRFEQCGFRVYCYKNDDLLSLNDIKKYGFIPNDTVFILEK